MGQRLTSLMLVSMTASCHPPADYALVGSAYVPAASGEIDVEKGSGDEILIQVTLDHLVSPGNLEEGLTHYVVWFTPTGEYPVRQRALDYDAEGMVGRAAIRTSLREFEVTVTAENGETPNRPSDLVVASQEIREK
jgi:hypothetical protein